MLKGIQSSPSLQGSVALAIVELSTAVPFLATELLLLAGDVVLSVSVRVMSDVRDSEPDGPGTSEVIVVVIVENVPLLAVELVGAAVALELLEADVDDWARVNGSAAAHKRAKWPRRILSSELDAVSSVLSLLLLTFLSSSVPMPLTEV